MNEDGSERPDGLRDGLGDGLQEGREGKTGDKRFSLLVAVEAQILQSISVRAPLCGILHAISGALDCDIRNVVSLISRGDGDGNDLGAIGDGAKRFGLHAFCFAGIFSEHDELIGSLQMFSSFRRSPSVEESRLIERATCLAAIAINLDIYASREASDAARLRAYLN